MSEELRSKLETLMEEAIDIRFKFEGAEFGAGPVELHSALVSADELLTELEKRLSRAIRAKARLDRKVTRVKMVWQEAYDKALTAPKRPAFGDSFVSGKEKSAEANLATFNEARVLRNLEEDASFANEAVDIIRLHYYGLDKIRQDVRKRLDESKMDYYS